MSTDSQLITPDDSGQPDLIETDQRSGCSGCGWGIAVAGCLVSVSVLIFAIAIFTGVATVSGIFDSIADIFRSEPRQATVDTTRTIITGIEARAQLVTISADFSRTNIRVSVRDGFQNTCGFSANHSAEGTILAGIDLSQITEDNVSYNTLNETYTITLPAPELISCSANATRYDGSFTMCNVDWEAARLIAEYTALTGFRDDALESGILGRAEVETHETLTEFLGALINADFEIVFEGYDPSGADTILPPSCQGEPPLGWTYDEASGTWSN